MELAIKKWGNSAAIRLPASLLQALHLGINSRVNIEDKKGKLVITPVVHEYDLDTMLNNITEENLHHEVDFGKPIGKEQW